MTLIYLDTSALVKLVVDEPESAALAEWLDDRPEQPLCMSAIGKAEVFRAARRHSPHALAVASSVLAELALVPTDAAVLELAALLEPAGLRTLDALHLASAAGLMAISPTSSLTTLDSPRRPGCSGCPSHSPVHHAPEDPAQPEYHVAQAASPAAQWRA